MISNLQTCYFSMTETEVKFKNEITRCAFQTCCHKQSLSIILSSFFSPESTYINYYLIHCISLLCTGDMCNANKVESNVM